ncbi:hypothetical protein BKA70DRAFT_1283424, partial [Coprinopsis sp. MPI-PUGE-AT-0042]
MASPAFPQELFEIIHPLLRTALYHLSLSRRRLGSYCRRYLWHTLSLTSKVPNRGEPLIMIPGYQKLCETLLSDPSLEPCIKRLHLQWGYKVLSHSGRRLVSERIPEKYTNPWATAYLTFVPKILATLKHLRSLQLEGDEWYVSGSQYETLLFPPTLECIRDNALLEVHVRTLSLSTALLSRLGIVKKATRRSTSRDVHLLPFYDVPNYNIPDATLQERAVSPKVLHLKVAQSWIKTMANQPVLFYSNLTTLDVYIIKRGPSDGIRAEHDLFELVHKRLIARSPSLQHLSIRYRNIDPKVYEDWSHELPLFLEDAPLLPSLTGTLKLELDFRQSASSTCPPSFEAFVNAYLEHRHLSEKINSFQLGIICSGEWGNNLAGCHWHGMDARLSNEMRFPHLKCVGLTLTNGYFSQGERKGLWGVDSRDYGQMVQEIGNAFMETRARGVDVSVELS